MILYITRLIILLTSNNAKNDFGIKWVIHYNQNNGNRFLEKIPVGYLDLSSKIICLSWLLTIVLIF